ncbi:hypothetical protein FHU28_004802 [Micromonospora echinospora]|uniref:Knr4/Smi1-like domain-containing protein n=1 Tax=Micromonospora echinospora TaxID=1877 RepID=A0ABR6MHW6_MICEC|nr:hypothetical protein [Micromonospora echinospora]
MKAVTTGSWDPQQALGLCRAFMAEWMGGVEAGDGVSAAELEATERALGFSIPPLLRDFHGLLGKRQDALRLQDPMLRPDEFYLDGPDIPVIREENQGSVLWGFPCDGGLDSEMKWKDAHSGSAARWRDYGQPLSAFLLEAVIGEACSASRCTPSTATWMRRATAAPCPTRSNPLSFHRAGAAVPTLVPVTRSASARPVRGAEARQAGGMYAAGMPVPRRHRDLRGPERPASASRHAAWPTRSVPSGVFVTSTHRQQH